MNSVPASVPSLSRRHAAGSASARGLLFTVLGEFVLPGGGTAWTSAFIELFSRLGVEEKATRQALMRTGSDGWLTAERIGRRTLWRLTPAAERLLVDGTERIYGFTGSAGDWDGRWLIVLARAPETERPTRHLLRTRLSWAGLGSPAPGVWVGPHAHRFAEAQRALREAGVLPGAQVFVAEHAGYGEPATMVRQAWDLDAIEASYEQFVARFSGRQARDALPAAVELVHAWRRFPWIDPALPNELLPTPWSGAAAAKLFARLHARWSAAAQAEWRELNS
ncbi:MAG TPA: PaaX family transcriptional regulator C-terminal domain-containing protein [Jatrophihabitans sp.]|jgi:phenylacetic acid degradation operon negative regulatory protein|nr:PaaX family transcriptional regulator C-terminal domain-containing protein [Jatrophihabitans sp.]